MSFGVASDSSFSGGVTKVNFLSLAGECFTSGPVQLQHRAPQSGVRVEETSSAIERFSPGPPKLPADSEEEKKALVKQESNQVENSAEDAANAMQPFRSTSERHKPY